MWVGTGGWHCWAQVGGTSEDRCVALLGGTGGCTAGHRRVHCWAQVGALLGTGGRNWWVALLGTDHQGTDHQCPELPVLCSTFLTL
ncbi:unnamed protein product [Staurois parvus]|uniref:Uncharacterized protein n=1 Tax=Staurois parvus TaxID=386267 RepID=A0ABN9DVB2_9NEOB|nr:unnamed protein product [Staurois parvus]